MLIFRQLGIAGLLALSSCSYFLGMLAPHKKPNNRVGEAKVVGVIELVNPEQSYVLINCEQRLNIPAGTELIAQTADGSKSKLKVSPERKGNYITADITEGTPQVRDLVLYQVKAGDPTSHPSTTPAAPTTSPPITLTPIMQADAIPPLDTPFQPMAPVRPAATPAVPALPSQSGAAQPPAVKPTDASNVDPSNLPPVIR